MAEWKDGLEFENNEIEHVRHNMSCFDLDFTLKDGVSDECKDILKSLFDEVMPIYLRQVYVGKGARPLPALLGDGQAVNLFRLFWVVKKKGGFKIVSENGLWGSVADECFLRAALIPSIKLVYVKYLKEFDGWLQHMFRDKRSQDDVMEIFKKLDLLIAESEELKSLVRSDENNKRNDGERGPKLDDATRISVDIDGGMFSNVHENMETGRCIALNTCTSEVLSSQGNGYLNEVNHLVKCSNGNEKHICIQGDKSIMFRAKCVVDNAISSQKIKLGSEVEVDKMQYLTEASRSNDNNEELEVENDYNISLPARSVVDKEISSMKNEIRSSPEVENGHENLASTYDTDENFPDYADLMLSAKRISDKVVSPHNKGKKLWSGEGINAVDGILENIKGDDGKVHVQDDANAELSLASVGNDVGISRKRKWQAISLSGMLNWVTQAARHSDDPAIGIVPGPSKWNDYGTEEYWVQALLAREALLVKRPICANLEEYSLQKKLKMHPLMYEDKNVHQSADGVRRSKRLPLSESRFCPCCNLGRTTRKFASPCKVETHNNWALPSSPMTTEELSPGASEALHFDEALIRHVSVGPSFQAEIPEWTGMASECDSKWLGLQTWDPEDEKHKTLVGKYPVGTGRQSSCDCSVPGSSSCVRLHIAEERLKLKLALGVLFYRWKFNRMGEEVSLSWTTEEEKRFKTMVLEEYTQNKFWNRAFKLFPLKTREKLVSYYFNVLVLRRRNYQNRVTPKNIDSDDDETEFGSIGDSAYFEGKNHATEFDLPECSLNMQYVDDIE